MTDAPNGKRPSRRSPPPLDAASVRRPVLVAKSIDRVPDVDPELVVLLIYARRVGHLVNAFEQRALREHDLDTSAFALLLALWYYDPPHRLSPAELCAAVVQTPGGVTRTVHRLASRKLVKRVSDPSDARLSDVQLTKKGIAVVRAALADTVTMFHHSLGEPAHNVIRRLADLQSELADVLELLLPVAPTGSAS